MSTQDTEFMRTAEAATYLKVSRAFLESARCTATGPHFVKLGRTVVYRKVDLDTFANAHVYVATNSAI